MSERWRQRPKLSTRRMSGLGYYRRARMMRECASAHRRRTSLPFFRDLPKSFRPYPESAAYTAAAIASIAFAEQLQFWTATSNEYCSA